MRGPRELHASEDTDRTMSTPPPGHDDLNESPVEQAVGLEVRGDGNERERAMPPDDEHNLFSRSAGMLSRGQFLSRGRGGHRGGRGGGHGGFGLRGPHDSHHGRLHGPRGMPPVTLPLPGAQGPFHHGHGRFVSRDALSPSMSRETFRARSAPPELRADEPEDAFPPEDFVRFRRPAAPFGGPHSRFQRPTPEGGCDRRSYGHHHHRHGRGGSEKFGRGRGHGHGGMFAHGRGAGGLGSSRHVRERMFPDLAEYPFGFGGRRGGRFPPGFGNGHHGCPMSMGSLGFDDPRAVMVGVGI
ncbi:hypothetical protein DAEQUDRAFT_495700 [Daedalea quercina L-15889]|uniref:Uncharacterized protein n=1 Tax=Daedalea quercina L-15889 TaxID=1314783 RepID=A0A165MKJ5_9APHY|nr:hypothetical protein DAEQUDRAFT_495700 [Daedalea quercina L-15889]